ncbi:MAG TPA: DUF2400 family protein [Candidatus Manganitrophaceae bacterium]|nr:DUF2400 family protein [Candidatus Manganitrophaceae bacterium]
MTRRQKERLGPALEAFYRRAPRFDRIQEDPVEFPRRYTDPKEIEAVGWLATAFAYGRVALFKRGTGLSLLLAQLLVIMKSEGG